MKFATVNGKRVLDLTNPEPKASLRGNVGCRQIRCYSVPLQLIAVQWCSDGLGAGFDGWLHVPYPRKQGVNAAVISGTPTQRLASASNPSGTLLYGYNSCASINGFSSAKAGFK